MIALLGATAIVAVTALILVIHFTENSRTQGRETFCEALVYVFRELTPPKPQAQARLQIALKETGLNDCHKFASNNGGKLSNERHTHTTTH